jgi:putative transposase
VFNDNVVKLIQPGILTDRLTEVLREGARALLTQAVEAEASEFLAANADLKTEAAGASCDTGICRSARS